MAEKNNMTLLQEKISELLIYIDEIKDSLNTVIVNNRLQKDEIDDLKNENNIHLISIYNLEKDFYKLNQYSRRENVEFMNIPENINQNKLEPLIIDLLNSAGLNISSYNIVAVHRIGRRNGLFPRNVICRFINRKDSIYTLDYKHRVEKQAAAAFNLRGLRVIENLCPENKKIFNACYKLKKDNQVDYVGSYNGTVYMYLPGDEEAVMIEHMDDINYFLNENNNVFYDDTNNTFIIPTKLNNNNSIDFNISSSDNRNSSISSGS